jgi:hypothetical protein
VASPQTSSIEIRLFWISACLIAGGTLLSWLSFGGRIGVSFLAGSALGGLNFAWLRQAVNSAFSRDPSESKLQVTIGFFLRLLLIPLCLYAMIRFLFFSVLAVVAGLAVFICSIFLEGVLEAFQARVRVK